MGKLLVTGGAVLVDDDLIPILSAFGWHLSSHGYASGVVKGKKMLMHRFIMGAKKEDLVDHINGDKLDNRRANLRFATKSQNAQNSRKKASKTGFIGVIIEWNGSIKAHIRFNGIKRHLGIFPTLIDAAKAYDAEALKLFGPEARTNLKNFKEIVLELSGGKEKGNRP